MRILFIAIISVFSIPAFAQKPAAENVVIVTLDGMRWQEIFGGADSVLSFDSSAKYSTNYVQKRFWAATPKERREKLMPFFWGELVTRGSIFGNRKLGNAVDNANRHWFSYPGYNEIFTGYPDTAVNSNEQVPNPNVNVFEYLEKTPAFKGKTAVVASWDVYTSIFNEKRSGIFVNDGFRDVPGKLNDKQILYNKLQHELPDLFHGPSERLDVATFHIGFEYMKANKPRLMYFGFGDTDEFAHAGLYDYYMDAANKTDQWIKEIWQYIQSDKFYAGKTTLIITTDHGRGDAVNGKWRDHGSEVTGAGQIWMAAIGAGVSVKGESSENKKIFQGQIAATISQLLGIEFKPSHPVLPALNLSAK